MEVADAVELSVKGAVEGSQLFSDGCVMLIVGIIHLDVCGQTGLCTQIHTGCVLRPPSQFMAVLQVKPSLGIGLQIIHIHLSAHGAEAILVLMSGDSYR